MDVEAVMVGSPSVEGLKRLQFSERSVYYKCGKSSKVSLTMQHAHIASRRYGTPLLIARPKLDVILSVLGNRIDWPELLIGMLCPTGVPLNAWEQTTKQAVFAL
jgi:hypothetical protein